MRQSKLFTKTLREAPKDEKSVNAQLLARGGFIYKNSAGVHTYLPLGWRVIEKIAAVIREEMNAVGGQELRCPSLIDRRYYEATGRGAVGIIFETKKKGAEQASFFIGWTHEEVLAEIATKYVSSYKDLPFAAYQIQTKFRNEPRAKSGLLREREFIMKDLYSFHATEEDFAAYYEKVRGAYDAVFKRCGLNAVYTEAAGGDFTASRTHEFQVPCPVGEDRIYVCEKCAYAENKEISKLKDGSSCPKCRGRVRGTAAIEVGNIFPLGTKYAEAFNLTFTDKDGGKRPVIMGSYGIGLGRTMATIVEIFHDEKGIVWPEAVAPFRVHLLEFPGGSGEKRYQDLQRAGVDVLYDDRQASPGEKLADADLVGIPYRFIVSEKNGDKVEVKKRNEKKTRLVSAKEAAALAQR